MDTNQEAIGLLRELVAIESVSSDPKRRSAVAKASGFLAQKLQEIGFSVEIVSHKNSHPMVVATYHNPNAKETIGIYAHYDVQPEDPIEQWNSPPFQLTLKDGKMYGRGVADDKGHVIQTIIALNSLIKSQKLAYSVTLLFEGEEEAGDASFEELLSRVNSADLSTPSAWFVFDMGMKAKSKPQIFTGLRGIVVGELSIRVADRDLHSGIFGNRVYSAPQFLVNVFGNMKNPLTGKVNVPGFYNDIKPISSKEYADLVVNADSKQGVASRSGARALATSHFVPGCYPKDMPLALFSKLIPSFEINGVWSGYTGVGSKTIIPATAHAKFSIRTVQGQSGSKMQKLIYDYLIDQFPDFVQIEIEMKSSEAVGVSSDNKWVAKTSQILSKHFGTNMIFNRSGGSIPAVEILSRLYNKPIVMTGFTLPDENIHSPNENIDEDMFFAGIEVLQKLFGAK